MSEGRGRERGAETRKKKTQDKVEEGAADGVCLSVLSGTAALNRLLAEADLLSDYTKQGSRQPASQVEQSPLGEEEEGEAAKQRWQRCFNKRGLGD